MENTLRKQSWCDIEQQKPIPFEYKIYQTKNWNILQVLLNDKLQNQYVLWFTQEIIEDIMVWNSVSTDFFFLKAPVYHFLITAFQMR